MTMPHHSEYEPEQDTTQTVHTPETFGPVQETYTYSGTKLEGVMALGWHGCSNIRNRPTSEDEHMAFCDINDKLCLLESNGSCDDWAEEYEERRHDDLHAQVYSIMHDHLAECHHVRGVAFDNLGKCAEDIVQYIVKGGDSHGDTS